MAVPTSVEACLVAQGAGASSDVDAASTIVQFVAAVRSSLFTQLHINSAASPSGGASSSIPTAIAYEVTVPPAPLLDPAQSLLWNLAHQFEGRLGRSLTVGEHVVLHEGMIAALAVHVFGDGVRTSIGAREPAPGRDEHRRRPPAAGVRTGHARGSGRAAGCVMDGERRAKHQRAMHGDRNAQRGRARRAGSAIANGGGRDGTRRTSLFQQFFAQTRRFPGISRRAARAQISRGISGNPDLSQGVDGWRGGGREAWGDPGELLCCVVCSV